MDDQLAVGLSRVANDLGLRREQIENVTLMLDSGSTVPFITRYRKERTGNLDETQIHEIQCRVRLLRQLAKRAEIILRLVDAQGKLTPELRSEVKQADTLKRLEDLYRSFRPKRTSRAKLARQRGLEPLANRVWNRYPMVTGLETAACHFVDPENGLPTVEDVLQGMADILAERISEDVEVRERARQIAWKTGKLTVTATKDIDQNSQDYRDYFDYSENISNIPPHRVLALNRGDKAGALRVKFEWDQEQVKSAITQHFQFNDHQIVDFLTSCITDALTRLIHPSLEREVRRDLTERAETHAVSVFSRNLKNLLLQPPLQGQPVLAIDPGFRTGCKLAMLDERGTCLATDVIYVTGSAQKKEASVKKLANLLRQHGCKLVAIGNGTACRETEELISETIIQLAPDVRYLIVNEAGASIYSTSNVAREEFPEYDATIRGTISIGRRLQDPLSELVKIDPQHIGVGMYQHDVNPKLLKESLEQVVESCVNFVGVDLNTASVSLLHHVSGLNQLTAKRVVEWREQNGPFRNRRQLLTVTGIGDTTFTQAAGFLKIIGGDDPLDSTWIHPESYESSHNILRRLSLPPESLIYGNGTTDDFPGRLSQLDPAALADELRIGLPTLKDILEALARPGRDPRTDLPGPVFKKGVLNLDDLADGMELTGTVLNVVDFGVFIDIGLKDSGLVHISQLSTRYIQSPYDLVSVGDVVTVWVLAVDCERKRVALTMIKPGTPREAKLENPSAKARPQH